MDIKCGQKHLFQRTQNLWVTINLYQKCFLFITWNKKHSSKQVVSVIYTLGKDLFAYATF